MMDKRLDLLWQRVNSISIKQFNINIKCDKLLFIGIVTVMNYHVQKGGGLTPN